MSLPIEVDHDRLADFCRRHHIRYLGFFGSVIHDDFGPESDVDVLVRFDAEHIPGLLALAEMEFELSDLLGRKADLRTPEDLSQYFRDKVVAEAATQYVA
ncbi:MAG: nucleotidyltransferase family protein [Armatimonadetes bacterium]|nr:nucleotidyltransferase family protein [Armatimonadota bacterium]